MASRPFLPGRLRPPAPGDKRPAALLVACGSFSPVTFMHLRMFEWARDHLERDSASPMVVVGGVASPVHDAYGKQGLAPAADRVRMLELALASSEWVSAARWETEQAGWTRTSEVLAHYEAEAQRALREEHGYEGDVRAMLLCGADLLRSAVTDLAVWHDRDRAEIFGRHGVACLERPGDNAAEMLREHPLLRDFGEHIQVVPQTITNDTSSSEVRRLVAAGRSPRYLVPDPVVDYIRERGLWRRDDAPPAP